MSGKNEIDTMVAYRIRIRGNLDSRWSDWFNGFKMMNCDEDTILTGSVPDQAALYGVLAKITELGLKILLLENFDIEDNES